MYSQRSHDIHASPDTGTCELSHSYCTLEQVLYDAVNRGKNTHGISIRKLPCYETLTLLTVSLSPLLLSLHILI